MITRSPSSIVSSTMAYPRSISDHYSVVFLLSSANPVPARTMRHLRDIRGINHDRFEADLLEHLGSVDINMDVSAVVDQYEHAVISTVDVHAPVTTRMKTSRRKEPWYNDDIHNARALRRSNEMRLRKTKLQIHRHIYVQHRTAVNAMITRAKRDHYESVLSSLDQRTCFRVVNTLLKPLSTSRPQSSSTEKLCSDFATYFAEKTQGIRVQIQKKLISDKEFSDSVVDVSSQPVSYQLNRLLPTTDEELRNIIKRCPSKTCSLDACPAELLKRALNIHIPYLVAIVNNSFEQGIFLNTLRTPVVKPLLKSDTINKDLLKKTTDQSPT